MELVLFTIHEMLSGYECIHYYRMGIEEVCV